MDTSLFDQMFPESPTDEDLPVVELLLFALRARGTDYESRAWRDLGEFLKKNRPDFKEFSDHFIKVADKIDGIK